MNHNLKIVSGEIRIRYWPGPNTWNYEINLMGADGYRYSKSSLIPIDLEESKKIIEDSIGKMITDLPMDFLPVWE